MTESSKGATPEALRGLPATELGRRVIQAEIDALAILKDVLDETFEKAIQIIEEAKGRVVIIGVGKSGHVGRKFAATLASTGTPAFFVHGTEAAHGDLGMLTDRDVVIAISNSGSTGELLGIIGSIRLIGSKLIAMTANRKSPLSRAADVTLCIGKLGEADPLGLAPTNTSTACLALGDAVAITLSTRKNFARNSFGIRHPGGALGREVLGSQFGRLAQWNQQHVFKFLNVLSREDKQKLETDLEDVDLSQLSEIYNSLKEAVPLDARELSPVSEYTDASKLSADQMANFTAAGLDVVAKGQLGLILLAGGQASKFGGGFKGFLDIGLPSHKCLLRLQLERAMRVRQMVAKKSGVSLSEVSLPIFVMVSHEVIEGVRDYLDDMNFFGLDPHTVFVFEQSTLPCVTPDGKMILETSKKIARAPDGHGGVYSALQKSGMLAKMAELGIEHLYMFGLDNLLCKVADPAYIGYCIDSGSDFAYKLVKRTRFDEHAGVVCKRNDKLDYVEHWELPAEISQLKADDGSLVYDLANILNLYYSREFLEKVITTVKPKYHAAVRSIPCADDNGERTSHVSGWKLQMNLLDCTPHAKKVSLLLVSREAEYAPIKAGWGNEPESPDAARQMLFDLHKKWVEAAGGEVQGATGAIEISPLVSLGGEDLEDVVKGKTFSTPIEIK